MKYALIAQTDANTMNADTVSVESAKGSLLNIKDAMLIANAGSPTNFM